ncbi:MAG: ribokinase, partial [Anaerolineales bacterium]|nr:ribokinase [Anaerolineales bacterium]
VGRLGADSFADTLLGNLDAARVDCAFVTRVADVATGVALIAVDDAGQNAIVVAAGANMQLSPTDVDAAEPAIVAADVVLLQLESPIAAVKRAAEIARAHGATVVLNPAPAQPLAPDVLALVDVLIPNESETALLAGQTIDGPAAAEAAGRALRQMGVPTVVLTLGERGALLVHGDMVRRFPAFQIAPVDTTAAGDAFVAGLAVALAEARPLDEAVRWGNAAGALAAAQLGAQPSLPTRAALEAFLSEATLRPD